MNIQSILAIILVLGAIAYIGYRTYNSLHKKDCAKGCGCAEIPVAKKFQG
jgi:hypothetical protein